MRADGDQAIVLPVIETANIPSRSALRSASNFLRTRHWLLWVGSGLFFSIVAILVLAPVIAPHDPATQTLLDRLQGPSSDHWLGTDHLGRDALSRLIYGGRFSVAIAVVTLVLSVAVGVIIGTVSARQSGVIDEIVMRIVDLLLSFPEVIVAMFLVAILGAGYGTVIIAITMVGWAPFARLARGLTLDINMRDYVKAAEVLGCTRSFIIFRHLIPNTFRPLAAMAFLRFGHKLITVGGLSFLGLGVQPPNSDWAAMLAQALPFIERAPLLVIAPGMALFITALSVTWIGQGLEFKAKSR